MVRETSCAILLCLRICPCRQPHCKDRAFARLARHHDVVAHHAGELAGDGEARVESGRAAIGTERLLASVSVLCRLDVFATTVASGHATLATERTPYLDRTSTGWIAPALPGALTQSPRQRPRAVCRAR
jgi:hypothetical protein